MYFLAINSILHNLLLLYYNFAKKSIIVRFIPVSYEPNAMYVHLVFNSQKVQETKKIEDYCMVPGVVNADKVIVQSREMKKVYIDILTGYTGRNTFDYWERKIAGLGSPKLEKVRNTSKKDI